MPVWNDIDLSNNGAAEIDMKQFQIELNRRLRYYLANINIAQILFTLNEIGGTLNLSKGGTGTSLASPAGDRLMFYDLSEGKVAWLTVGTGLSITGTTIAASLAAVILGTTNQVTVTDNLDGTYTLSTPQNIHSTATPTFSDLTLSNLTASRLTATNGSSKLASVADLTSWIAGTTNQVTVTSDGDGTVTLSTPQDITTTSNVTFANITGSLVKGTTGQFGNVAGGHYSEFEADGTLEAIGDARTIRDELGDVTTLRVVGTGVAENDAEATMDFSTLANLSDYIYTNVQLNHDRDLSANIYPHIHWFQAETNVPNFLLQYRWQTNAGAKVTSWTDLKCNTAVHAWTSGTIHQICRTASGIAVPAGTTLSDIIQFRILRDNAPTSAEFGGVADPYTATVGVLSFDVHIVTNTLGSRSEYSK